MLDKIIGIAAILAFVSFAIYIASKIGETDLWVVVVIVSIFAAYDFYLEIFRGGQGNGSSR